MSVTAFIPQNTWFKVLHDAPYNHKLEFVAMKCKARMCEVLAVWLCELDAASKNDPRGYSNADPELVAFKQGIELKMVERIMAAFRAKDRHGQHLLINNKNYIVNWHSVQPMTPTERSRNHREKQAAKKKTTERSAQGSRNAGALQGGSEARKPRKQAASSSKAQPSATGAEAGTETQGNAGALQPLQTKKEKNQKKEISKHRGVERKGAEQNKAEQTHTGKGTEGESTKGETKENPAEPQASEAGLPQPNHPKEGQEGRGSAGAEHEGTAADDFEQQCVATWNRIVTSRPVSKLTDKRKKLLAKRIKDSFGKDIARFEQFCRAVAASDFLMGRTSDGFAADLSWVLDSEDRVAEIEGGRYSRGQTAPAAPPPPMEPPEPLPAELAEAWERVCEDLPASAAGLKAKLRLYAVRSDGAVVVSAPTKFDAAWADSHYRRDIQQALEAEHIFGGQMTALVFTQPEAA